MADVAKTSAPTLPKEVFAVEVPSHDLLKLAYDSYLADARQASATTKTRGLVRGGGKKPWKQKGTGRARFGSSRNPIWRGGGIVFGPLGNENYKKSISKTSKRVAIKQALTLAHQAKKVHVLDIKTTGKTKEVVALLAEQKFTRNTLIVSEKTSELLQATANIQSVKLSSPTYLNVFDILNADHIVISKAALGEIKTWLVGEENAA